MLSAPVRLTALLLVLVIAATGCHRGAKKGDRPDEGTPVEQLYEKSHKLMQGGNWSGAEPASAASWPSIRTARIPNKR